MRIVLTLLLLAMSASAQWLTPVNSPRTDSDGNPVPLNNFGTNTGTYVVTPNSGALVGVCVYQVNSDGTITWVPGDPVTMQAWATTGSGWHRHEHQGDYRPNPSTTNSFSTLTGLDGCGWWPVQQPKESGWWTYQFLNPGAATKGYNVRLKVGASGVNVRAPNPSPQLADLPHRQDVLPAVFGPAVRASAGGDPTGDFDGYHCSALKSCSRYFLPVVGDKIWKTALVYQRLLDIGYTPGMFLYWDTITPQRGSIPDGGTADNEYQSSIWQFIRWHTDDTEDHFSGAEVDIKNPYLQQGVKDFYNLLVSSMEEYDCHLGPIRYDGTVMTDDEAHAYWQPYEQIHFFCATVSYGKPGGPAPPRNNANGGRGK